MKIHEIVKPQLKTVSDKLSSEETAWRTAVDSIEIFLSDAIGTGGGTVSDKLESEEDAWRTSVNSVETFLSDAILAITATTDLPNYRIYGGNALGLLTIDGEDSALVPTGIVDGGDSTSF